MRYGLTIENCNLAIDKAKTKKNGVYTMRGFLYRVKEHKVTHYAYAYEILECFGHFNCKVGSYSLVTEVRKRLATL